MLNRRRALRLLVVMILLVATLGVGQGQAQAHSTYACTGANTSSQSWHTGSNVRFTASNHGNTNVVWSFFTTTGCSSSVLPGGGSANLSMRLQFCSGGGGNSIGSTFSSVTAKQLATSVLPGTCFKVQWRPNNSATDFANFHGKLLWTN